MSSATEKSVLNLQSNVWKVDDIIQLAGFGKFQVLLGLLLAVSILPSTLEVLLAYFTQHNPNWQCTYNSTVCTFYGEIDASNAKLYKQRCDMPRNDWRYSKPDDYSIVTEFDLYCDTEVYSYVATSLFFLSWALGSVVLGYLADRYGRLKVLIASQTAIIIIGFLSAFSPNIGVYIAARAIIGFFVPGSSVNLFILASEFVGTRYRPMAGNLLWLFFTIGLILLGVKAYFIRQWKILIIVCTAPYVFCLIFFKLIPESIRWLRLDGQSDKALNILRKMGRINKREIPEDIKLAPTDENSSHKSSPMDIFRTKKRAVASFIQGYAWAVNGVVYYGITFASDDLGGSMYRDYILASLIEFPSYLSSMYLCNRFGRKKTVSIPMFIASVGCILVAFIPYNSSYTHWTVLRVVCGMIGKFCIALSFGSIYIWSAELYPTTVRGQGLGFLQIASRFGSAFAPWVAKWLKVFHYVLPFAVMGGSSLIAAIMLQWLPETANKPSPESLEEDRETPSDQHISLRSSETEMLNMQHTETEPV